MACLIQLRCMELPSWLSSSKQKLQCSSALRVLGREHYFYIASYSTCTCLPRCWDCVDARHVQGRRSKPLRFVRDISEWSPIHMKFVLTVFTSCTDLDTFSSIQITYSVGWKQIGCVELETKILPSTNLAVTNKHQSLLIIWIWGYENPLVIHDLAQHSASRML